MPEDPATANPPADPAQGQPAGGPEPSAGGEPQAPPVDTGPTAGEEPRLYAGRFNSVEEMERAYSEANSAIGRKDNELGQHRQEVNYWRQQMGYDPLDGEWKPADPAPTQQPQAPWDDQPYGPQPAPQPYPQAPPQPTGPEPLAKQEMDAYLAGDYVRMQQLRNAQIRSGARLEVSNQHQQVLKLQQGLQGLVAKYGHDTVFAKQQEILAKMAMGNSADDAFYLVNRGAEATQQRTAAERAQQVSAARAAATGPAGVPTPATPQAQDPGAQLKADMLAAGDKAEPGYQDL